MLRLIGAAALLVAYLLPVLLPGTGALAHDAYHALIAHEPAEHSQEPAEHSHEPTGDGEDHGHVHSAGGERHVHAPLVDVLLVVSSADDEVSPDPATGPGVNTPSHLAARSPSTEPARPRESPPLRLDGETLAGFLLDPEVPPPRT